MKGTLAFAASLTLAGSLACATMTNTPVTVTKAESAVTSCAKVGDVAVEARTSDSEVRGALAEAARQKGANTVLVSSDAARSGSAYRCEVPRAAAR